MKNRHTLYLKFIIAYVILAALCIAVVELCTAPLSLSVITQNQAEQMYSEANMISNDYANSMYNDALSPEEINLQLRAIETFSDTTVWIIATNGVVLYRSDNIGTESNSEDTFTIEEFNPEDAGAKYYMIGDFYSNFPEQMLSVLAPITSDFRVKGYVVLHRPMSIAEKLRDELKFSALITVGIVFFLSTVILAVFTIVVYLPLRKITKATHAYAEGNFGYELTVPKNDEIGYLAASLNYMAGELSQFEGNQKKFIANVSHDFRSPLTSIKGYLVAMVDGTIPPELHEKYLNIVLNETERLTKLTNSLLTLNNLNIAGITLELSDFDINAIIKKSVATFEGTCTNKRIRIRLVLTGNTLLVHADMGKIQQVLYNLIDNAIKFSHHDSEIKVETTEKNEKVFVSVKDSGIGIPKENLKQIFDRFYKTDISRGRDKKGTGLGLSIVKEIINAHHENINVISTVDVGTEFIFTLPKSKQQEDDDL